MDNQGPNNYNYNNGPGNNGSGGNGNNGGNRPGGNGGRNNRGGQGIMAFILLTLVALFVYALISNSISEGAIFINMGIPFLTGTKLPFIASIVIGTIQLV